MEALKTIFRNVLQNRIVQHILFWTASYYYLIHSFSITNNIEKIDYIYTGVFHLTIVSGVYINLYVLIPRVLGKKRYLLYAVLFMLLLAVTAQVNIFIFSYAIDFFIPDYFFVSNFSFFELVQFGFVYLGLTSLLKLSKAWFKLLETKNHLIRLEREKASSELLFLKMQINPHFLFNSLNNIYSLALKSDPKTPDSLLKLAEVMRYMIYESTEEFVPLQSEINYIHNYINLQRLRTSDGFNIQFEVAGSVDNQQVAPLIFIVFIENSFKHSAHAGRQQSFVNIKIAVNGNDVHMTVENSKGIVDEVERKACRGLGLDNVKRRLELLYPDTHHLLVTDTDEKYTVGLSLQCKR